MSYDKIKVRRGTEAQWLTKDPILLLGEEAYVTDKRMSKHGDGIKKFSQLEYDTAADKSFDIDIFPGNPRINLEFDIDNPPNGSNLTGSLPYNEIFKRLIYPYDIYSNISLNDNNDNYINPTREFTNAIINPIINIYIEFDKEIYQKYSGIIDMNNHVKIYFNGNTITIPVNEMTLDINDYYITYSYSYNYNGTIKPNSQQTITFILDIELEDKLIGGIITRGSKQDIKFIYPTYIGTISPETTNPTDADIKNMVKKVVSKQNFEYDYNGLECARFAISYPKLYGKLKYIHDSNGLNIISDFDIKEVNVTQYDGVTKVLYYVYVYKNVVSEIKEKFNITYKFN